MKGERQRPPCTEGAPLCAVLKDIKPESQSSFMYKLTNTFLTSEQFDMAADRNFKGKVNLTPSLIRTEF
jgi:hypothetical protein